MAPSNPRLRGPWLFPFNLCQRICPLTSQGYAPVAWYQEVSMKQWSITAAAPQERLACSCGFIPPEQPLLFSRNRHPSVLTGPKTKAIKMLVCKPKHTSLNSLQTHQTEGIDLRAPSLLTNNKEMGGGCGGRGMGSGHKPSSLPWPCILVTFPYT